ncbi:hypothetical protein [Kitasatospora cathayae]|uniref:Uncharacterized protein n=1 Tax=Kitasatospora cathayae TaxID=3004092 RepID=A0ABY7QA28_9ACTN|nr:hypothetical protein [Kitasatospora sp. HUAS 3-15]WBP89598.1 hypothetical protein O1G21_29645 [Kitasatospora sp. HUAS 3-15]
MTNFIAWAFAAWACVLLAGLIALYLPVDAGQPFQSKPVTAQSAPEPKTPALGTIPKHVIDWRQPLEGEANRIVRPYTPEAVEAPPQHPVTLVGTAPAKNVRERRAAAFAAQLDLPDPLHWLDDATTTDRVLTGAGA